MQYTLITNSIDFSRAGINPAHLEKLEIDLGLRKAGIIPALLKIRFSEIVRRLPVVLRTDLMPLGVWMARGRGVVAYQSDLGEME